MRIDSEMEIFLVDNGSLAPEATLQLRGIASALSMEMGHPVEAVSLLHSHKVDASALDGASNDCCCRMRSFCGRTLSLYTNTAFFGTQSGNYRIFAEITRGIARGMSGNESSAGDCFHLGNQ